MTISLVSLSPLGFLLSLLEACFITQNKLLKIFAHVVFNIVLWVNVKTKKDEDFDHE